MTFDEWWETVGSRFIGENYKSGYSEVWSAATLAERERCVNACVKWDGLRMNGVEEVIRRGE